MFPVSKVLYSHSIHGPNRVSPTIVSRFSGSGASETPSPRNMAHLAAGAQAASGSNFCQAASLRLAQPHKVPRRPSSASNSASR